MVITIFVSQALGNTKRASSFAILLALARAVFFRHALLHQGVGMLFFQCFDQLQVVFGIGVHCINKSRFGRRISLNFRGIT